MIRNLAALALVWVMAGSMASAAVSSPVLKWQKGGCYSSWCETGWYSSPAVGDVDGDGKPEVLAGGYKLFMLNGEDGSLQWSSDSNAYRLWPGVVMADLDGDGALEFAMANGGGFLTVYGTNGVLRWSRQPVSSELRSLAASDLDGDGWLELIVSSARSSAVNTWVYGVDGTLKAGWPQLSTADGYAAGVYNANVAAGDLTGDGQGEVIVPSDVHYICAYTPSSSMLQAGAPYSKPWGKVGVWESTIPELRGWGECSGDRAERYRTNFADGPALIADMDGDGLREVVVTGKVYDCAVGQPPDLYIGPYIFNADRTRFVRPGADWSLQPRDTGAPLSEDYNVIETCEPNPVAVDLDGDGKRELLFPSFDGRMHAFWLDGTEHGSWPLSATAPGGTGIYFASEPVVADLDNDGKAEVIFTTWTAKGSFQTGELIIASYLGVVLQRVSLPAAFGGPDWNGALPAPTLANIDSDSDLEVVVNTAHSGIAAYDLPGTSIARILWRTGRGNWLRNGVAVIRGDLDGDTRVTAADLSILQNYVVGNLLWGKAPFKVPLDAGDLTEDGQVRSADILALALYLAGR